MSAHTPLRLNTELPPWDRQPGEQLRDHHAFQIFRALKPVTRRGEGTQRVAEQTGRTPSAIGRLAVRNRWHERAIEYDQHLEMLAGEDETQKAREAHQRTVRFVDRLTTISEDAWDTLDPADLTPSQLLKLTEIITRVRPTLYGQPTTRIELAGNMEHQVQASLDVSIQRWLDMPPSDRNEHIQQLAADVLRKQELATQARQDDDQTTDH